MWLRLRKFLAMIDVEYICMVKKKMLYIFKEKYPDLKAAFGESD